MSGRLPDTQREEYEALLRDVYSGRGVAEREAERRLKIYSEVCKLCGWDYPEAVASEQDSGWPAGSLGHMAVDGFDMCQAAALKRMHAERDKAGK